jgi:two-component system response regulator NreC
MNLKTVSDREIDVLKLHALGYISKMVGAKLGISEKTVEKHRHAVYQKFGVNNTMDMVRYAIVHKVIDVHWWMAQPFPKHNSHE